MISAWATPTARPWRHGSAHLARAGIGKEIARMLVSLGADTVIMGSNSEKGEAARREVSGFSF